MRGEIGRLKGLRLLVDTGTSRTVVDQRIARALELPGTPDVMHVFGERVRVQRVTLPRLRVGPMEATGLSVLSADLTRARRDGWRPDAIVGLDVLRGHCFVVDYRTRRLSFACREDWTAHLPCDLRSSSLVARVAIDDHVHRLFIDTGFEALALFERMAAHLRHADGPTVAASSATGTVQLRRVIVDRIVIAAQQWRGHAVFVIPGGDERAGHDGLLGVSWLGPRVQVDLARMVVSWSPHVAGDAGAR